MFVWPYVRLHILCTQLVICLLLDFIHIWYLGWPWSEHAHISISRIVYFCESYSPFHVCLTICPSTHLVYATSHLSFVGFYSYFGILVGHDLSIRILYRFQGWLIFAPTVLGGFQHSLHSFMPLHHVKFHYYLILYYTSTLCRASGGITARQRVQFHFSSSIMAQILNSKWLFVSNSSVFVEWVIIINAKWAIFQLYHDKSFLERVIIFQRYHGKNKLYLMRWFSLCTRPFEHT